MPIVSERREVQLISGDLYCFYVSEPVTMADQLMFARSRNCLPFDLQRAKSLLAQLLEVMKVLHSYGVLHRNLKPEHLLLDYVSDSTTVKLKVADFAMDRVYSFTQRDFSPDKVTRWYRCPEILMSQSSSSRTVSMWSIGCVMAEMSLDRPLFCGKNQIGLAVQHFPSRGHALPRE
jgi:serine/threonine protein kinase